MGKKVNLFLDSGAFSAWSKGKTISLSDYGTFLKDNLKYIEVYSNLDVIGNAEESWSNQKKLEDLGLSPLPVFHLEDDIPYLHKCLEYPYFCLGGMAGRDCSKKDRIMFLDKCWDIICDTPDKMPKCKVHGFGMTAIDLMWRYPWYSVDSTSWVATSRYGSVFIPKIKQGEYRYNEKGWTVTVSNKSPSTKEEGKHITTFTGIERKQILKYLALKGYILGESKIRQENRKEYKLKEGERWFGKAEADGQRSVYGDRNGYVQTGWEKDRMVETIITPGLCNDYKLRDELNIIYYKDLEAAMPEWPWPFIQSKQTKLGVLSK